MIFLVIAKTKRCLPVLLFDGGVNLEDVEISDYKEFRDGEKSLILIGDGRKLRPILNRLCELNGRSNFDYCLVEGE